MRLFAATVVVIVLAACCFRLIFFHVFSMCRGRNVLFSSRLSLSLSLLFPVACYSFYEFDCYKFVCQTELAIFFFRWPQLAQISAWLSALKIAAN